MKCELINTIEKIENERQKGTTFKKRITMKELTKVASLLDPVYHETEDVADNATAVMQEENYSESTRKKLISQLTTMFILDAESDNFLLKGEIRDAIALICDRRKQDEEFLSFLYLCLMMMSHKNFAEMVAALAPMKRNNTLFTLKIFVQSLPEALRAKSPATTYENCDQFLMQMEELGLLNKVAQVYRVKNLNLIDDLQTYAREIIYRLPISIEEDLYEVLGIEKLPKPAPEAVQD